MCTTAHSMSPSVSVVMLLFSRQIIFCDRWNREHWGAGPMILAMRMIYLLKTERDAACEAKTSTLSVITPASPR